MPHVRHVCTRRELLSRCANGFGAAALAALLNDPAYGAAGGVDAAAGAVGTGALPELHHPAKARQVIFLYMDGGPSQVDTFDPKPRLAQEHGRPIGIKTPPTQFNNVGNVLASPWKFRPRGKSGIPVSDLFPHVAECVDDLAIVRSMTSKFSEHTNANYFLHSGHGQQGRPSMGSWVTYGLGSECHNLPGFVVLDCGMIPPGGLDCFNNGFLPATFQGSLFRAGGQPVADVSRSEPSAALQDNKLDLLRSLDAAAGAGRPSDPAVEAAIANYELACRMQTAVPDLLDIRGETQATRNLYGLDEPATQLYGGQCLLARRLIERGVRFVELLCPQVPGDRWDQHEKLREGHENNAQATDKPVAGLLKDLKARGLLNETLVIWGGEFGRTPMAQGSDGRDHNPLGFSIWLAGGGVKGGVVYGATDDYGYYAVEHKHQMHDLHATMLHLLGIDHKRLVYRFGGRDMRLTDVHGELMAGILA